MPGRPGRQHRAAAPGRLGRGRVAGTGRDRGLNTAATVTVAVEHALRHEWGRVLAGVARACGGDLTLAEDATGDAFLAALETWPRDGVPANAAAWLATTARRKALDRLRRSQVYADKLLDLERQLALTSATPAPWAIPDERLELIFGCCHPALAREAQVALTLRCLSGLSTAEIARAFLVPEATMAQRLVRARKKMRTAAVPLRVPGPADLPDRLPAVLAVLYLVFNEGFAATDGPRHVRADLCERAVDLAEVLVTLLPAQPEALGLLALLLLHQARRDTRTDDADDVVLLAHQDRSRWHAAPTDRAEALLSQVPPEQAGRYVLEAAIALVHARAATYADTDWPAVAHAYGRLRALADSPVLALNEAVAVGMARGPAAGLARLDALEVSLSGYHYLHAARGELLRAAGDRAGALIATRTALGLAGNAAERRLLQRRCQELST